MTTTPCPICTGPTFEIRAKLVCRQCGAILETCCEGGPMGPGCQPAFDAAAEQPAAPPAPPESSEDSRAG